MKNYSKKTKKTFTPRFSNDGQISQEYINDRNDNYKQNRANFDTSLPSWHNMSAEDKYKFELEREADKRGSHSTFN